MTGPETRMEIDPRDEAWLLARERGETMTPPSAEAERAYARIERALAELPLVGAGGTAGAEATDEWQARVLAELPENDLIPIDRARRARRVRRWVSLGMPAVAAAAGVLLWMRSQEPPPRGEPIAVSVRRGETVRRAGEGAPSVGDVLGVVARVGAAGELRIYRGERALVGRCPGDRGCRASGEGAEQTWAVDVPLDAPGRYQVIGLVGARGGASTGVLDSDLAAAMRAGATVVSAPVVDVQ